MIQWFSWDHTCPAVVSSPFLSTSCPSRSPPRTKTLSLIGRDYEPPSFQIMSFRAFRRNRTSCVRRWLIWYCSNSEKSRILFEKKAFLGFRQQISWKSTMSGSWIWTIPNQSSAYAGRPIWYCSNSERKAVYSLRKRLVVLRSFQVCANESRENQQWPDRAWQQLPVTLDKTWFSLFLCARYVQRCPETTRVRRVTGVHRVSSPVSPLAIEHSTHKTTEVERNVFSICRNLSINQGGWR